MGENKQYALWLMPSGEAYERFNRIVCRLSREWGGPLFEPHITLMGHLSGTEREIVSKAKTISQTTAPFEIEFTEIDYLEEYFRCLFIHVKKHGSLLGLRLKSEQVFNRLSGASLMPHLSLLYGHFPYEIKEEIIQEIGRCFNFPCMINEMALVASEGDFKNWTKVGRFVFEGTFISQESISQVL